MARPTKYNETLGIKLCSLIREGAFVTTAAKSCGIALRTVYVWLERGEADPPAEGDDAFVTFAELFRAAEADAEIALMRELLHPPKSTHPATLKAKAWFAEKRWPLRFGAKVSHEVSGPNKGPIEASVTARVVVLPAVHDPATRDDSVAAEPRPADGVPEQPG